MTSQRFLYGCGIIVLVSLFYGTSFAELSEGNAINNLYENLLQREYAGPISFPERVERKSQRSPSLRLRFGRSDPDMIQEEKRWFGDVDQKPIRSPSLRLRFGRTDPSMKNKEPINWDENEYQRISQKELIASIINSEKLRNLLDNFRALNENEIISSGDVLKRKVRQDMPRLRWGRSIGVSPSSNEYQRISQEELIDSIINSEKLRNLLDDIRALNENEINSGDVLKRKVPQDNPKLRWDRSAGNAQSSVPDAAGKA